jgi:hypothetical protein
VREFAKTSAATADNKRIVADYVSSPERQKRFQPQRAAPALDEFARQRKEQQAILEGAQTVLVEYLNALGNLAADALPQVDSEIEALRKSLETAKFVGDGDAAIGKETATAASTIAKVLVREALEHWRQAHVRALVKETDASIQTLVEGLREVVVEDFARSLAIEEEAVRKYFEKSISDALAHDQPDSAPPLARILWLDRKDQNAARQNALSNYAAALAKIGTGHADLRANVGKFEDKALEERLRRYAKDLQTLYKAMATLSQ